MDGRELQACRVEEREVRARLASVTWRATERDVSVACLSASLVDADALTKQAEAHAAKLERKLKKLQKEFDERVAEWERRRRDGPRLRPEDLLSLNPTPLRRDRLVSEKRRVDRVVDRVRRELHPRGESCGRTERGEATGAVARCGRWEVAARNSLIAEPLAERLESRPPKSIATRRTWCAVKAAVNRPLGRSLRRGRVALRRGVVASK